MILQLPHADCSSEIYEERRKITRGRTNPSPSRTHPAELTARNIGHATTQDRPPSDEACVKASPIMLLTRLWNSSTRAVLRRRMPTNILLDTRRGLEWGIPAMLLGVIYIFAAAYCSTLIAHGWSK